MIAKQRVRSIFRYPGAKSGQATGLILGAFPTHFSEYREPFLGGGSIALCVDHTVSRWLGDVDARLINCHETAVHHSDEFIRWLREIPPPTKDELTGNKQGWQRLIDRAWQRRSDEPGIENAVNYFILQRLSWGGKLYDDSRKRVYLADLANWKIVHQPGILEAFSERLNGCRFTCSDFASMFTKPALHGGKVFIYADPPYWKDAQRVETAKLYRHSMTPDDHIRLAQVAKASGHLVLLSMDDTPEVRELYKSWSITSVDWHYSLTKKTGKELLISNYAHAITDSPAHFADLGRMCSERKAAASRVNGMKAQSEEAKTKMREAWERRRRVKQLSTV